MKYSGHIHLHIGWKMMNEIWMVSSVDGYEVSNYGNVRSVDRRLPRSDTGTSVFYKGRYLKLALSRAGYLKARVSTCSDKKTLTVHREVANLFVENREGKPQVNHIDGCKTNNHYMNLEWVTNTENQNHAIRTGLKVAKTGEFAPRVTNKVDVYKGGVYICTLIGCKQTKQFGLDPRLVHRCIKGKTKTHKGYTFIATKLRKEQE